MSSEGRGEFASNFRIINSFYSAQRLIDGHIKPSAQLFLDNHHLNAIYHAQSPRELFSYHDVDHHLNVTRRGIKVLELARDADPTSVSDKDFDIIQVGAQGHDISIKAFLDIDKNGMLVLNQRSVVSEEGAADVIADYMSKKNEESDEIVFTDEDIQAARACARITIPAFNGTAVIQPQLSNDMPMAAIATAFGDLGSPIDGPQRFKISSNDLFRERYIGIRLILERAQTQKDYPMTYAEKNMIVQAVMDWSRGQIEYLNSRREQLAEDVQAIGSQPARAAILKHFQDAHDAALAHMQDTLDKRQELVDAKPDQWLKKLLLDCEYQGDILEHI